MEDINSNKDVNNKEDISEKVDVGNKEDMSSTEQDSTVSESTKETTKHDDGLNLDVAFSAPEPYPEVKVAEPNPYYVRLIMDDYCGAVSEMTAINQYDYHSFVTQEHREFFEVFFEKIAEVEMRHLEILSQIIVQLGGMPIYRGGVSTQGSWWTGRLVYYGRDLCDRLRADLESEYQAIRGYQENIRVIQDGNIQEVLARIIEDERVHVKLFEAAIEKYCT